MSGARELLVRIGRRLADRPSTVPASTPSTSREESTP